MRPLTCTALCGVVFSLIYPGLAQQPVTKPASTRPSLDGRISAGHEGTLAPSTTPGFATKFTTLPPAVEDSLMFQEGTSRIDVQGKFNLTGVSNSYAIVANPVLGVPGTGNVFAGVGAGTNTTTGHGNLFSGQAAGNNDAAGRHNTFSGTFAGFSNTDLNNTFTGSYAGFSNASGNRNVFAGAHAGYNNVTAPQNTFFGFDVGFFNTSGRDNTFFGNRAGYSNTTGSYNIFLGDGSGVDNQSGSHNIYIGSQGCGVSCNEDNHVRIGGLQSSAYIMGVYNSTVAGGVPVYVNSSGQFGTQTSSLRFKERIHDMVGSTDALMQLRPVTFLYKPAYDHGTRALQFGLIAEEVAKVYPGLVTYQADSLPDTVRYQFLSTMLLNEIQKQYRLAEAGTKVIERQQEEIDLLHRELQQQEQDFQRRLSRLEETLEK
jgi:hypothetical protein